MESPPNNSHVKNENYTSSPHLMSLWHGHGQLLPLPLFGGYFLTPV